MILFKNIMNYKYTTIMAKTNEDYLQQNSNTSFSIFHRLCFPHRDMIWHDVLRSCIYAERPADSSVFVGGAAGC